MWFYFLCVKASKSLRGILKKSVKVPQTSQKKIVFESLDVNMSQMKIRYFKSAWVKSQKEEGFKNFLDYCHQLPLITCASPLEAVKIIMIHYCCWNESLKVN